MVGYDFVCACLSGCAFCFLGVGLAFAGCNLFASGW